MDRDTDRAATSCVVGTVLALPRLVPPLRSELDARAFREALTMVAEATNTAVAICDEVGKVLHATTRARRLLGAQIIPTTVLELVEKNSDEPTKIALEGTVHAVHARAQRLPGTIHLVLVMLVEDAPRSELSKSLVSRFGLSARAIQLVQLTSRGLTNREIAGRLRLSEATVKTYMHGLFREVGVRNRAELVALAERMV